MDCQTWILFDGSGRNFSKKIQSKEKSLQIKKQRFVNGDSPLLLSTVLLLHVEDLNLLVFQPFHKISSNDSTSALQVSASNFLAKCNKCFISMHIEINLPVRQKN